MHLVGLCKHQFRSRSLNLGTIAIFEKKPQKITRSDVMKLTLFHLRLAERVSFGQRVCLQFASLCEKGREFSVCVQIMGPWIHENFGMCPASVRYTRTLVCLQLQYG